MHIQNMLSILESAVYAKTPCTDAEKKKRRIRKRKTQNTNQEKASTSEMHEHHEMISPLGSIPLRG